MSKESKTMKDSDYPTSVENIHVVQNKYDSPSNSRVKFRFHVVQKKVYISQPQNKDPENFPKPFDIGHDLYKINISIPLTELAWNPAYMKKIEKD